MASTTAATIIARAAQESGRYVATTVTTQAVGADPARILFSSELRHDGGPSSWVGAFVQLTAAGTVRRVLKEWPDRGGLVLDQALSGTQAVTTAFSAAWPLPLADTEGIPGWLTFLGQATRDVWYPDSVDITTQIGVTAYDLTTQKEWLCEERVTGMLDPSAGGTYQGQPSARYDGLTYADGVPTLNLKWAYRGSGATAQLLVRRPAYTRVNAAESTTGPTATTDTVYADQNELVAVTKLRAFRWLATAAHLDGTERAAYAEKAAMQDAWVRANVKHYIPRDEMTAPQSSGKAA